MRTLFHMLHLAHACHRVASPFYPRPCYMWSTYRQELPQSRRGCSTSPLLLSSRGTHVSGPCKPRGRRTYWLDAVSPLLDTTFVAVSANGVTTLTAALANAPSAPEKGRVTNAAPPTLPTKAPIPALTVPQIPKPSPPQPRRLPRHIHQPGGLYMRRSLTCLGAADSGDA